MTSETKKGYRRCRAYRPSGSQCPQPTVGWEWYCVHHRELHEKLDAETVEVCAREVPCTCPCCGTEWVETFLCPECGWPCNDFEERDAIRALRALAR